jgi:hypothetical protein
MDAPGSDGLLAMTAALVDVHAEINRLYQRPLDEFVAARKDLAARLTEAGNREAADRVRALKKPPLSAWIINQLYWQSSEAFDRLLDAGDRLRAIQREMLEGKPATALAEATGARERAVEALLKEAARIARAAGVAFTQATRQRTISTLEAIASHGRSPDRPDVGRLDADVDPPGLSLLSALAASAASLPTPKPPPSQPRVVHGRKSEASRPADVEVEESTRAAAREAVEGFRNDVARAEQRAKETAAAVALASRAKERVDAEVRKRRGAVEAAEQQLAEVLDAAAKASEALKTAERESAAATHAMREAEWRLRQTQTALAKLDRKDR